MLKWKYGVVTANVFLRDVDVCLDCLDVFVSRDDKDMGMQINKVSAHWLKLIFHEYDNDLKSSSDVLSDQGFKMFEYVAVSLCCPA